MKVDIVIAVAERGGVENVICDTAIYLKNSGWKVRIIQLVWEGFCWTPSDISFSHFYMDAVVIIWQN